MNKIGKIIKLVPDGGYNSQNGYIYTFQMTIECSDGQYGTGQIGSKSEQYPLGIGQEICVDVTQTQHGTRFKKINPQYSGQQGSQSGQQAPSRPPQGNKPDWDAISKGKVRHGVVCAYLQAGQEPEINRVLYWVDFIMTGIIPPPPSKEPENLSREAYGDDIPY